MSILVQYRNDVPSVKIRIDALPFSIGRSEECNLCLDDDLASRQHAVVEQAATGDGYILRDGQSTNGTYVNGDRIEAHVLRDGDWVRIGRTFFKFAESEQSDLNETMVVRKSIIPGVFFATKKPGGKPQG
jgi:pSer/pThr/pTyr-binding forkhead associated (FHA) protein